MHFFVNVPLPLAITIVIVRAILRGIWYVMTFAYWFLVGFVQEWRRRRAASQAEQAHADDANTDVQMLVARRMNELRRGRGQIIDGEARRVD